MVLGLSPRETPPLTQHFTRGDRSLSDDKNPWSTIAPPGRGQPSECAIGVCHERVRY
jgi:hypothetical protein